MSAAAFSTSGRQSWTKSHHKRFIREQTTDLKDRVDDLESALALNTLLLQDIITSKTVLKPDASQETETGLMFPAACYKLLRNQQEGIQTCIQRQGREIEEAKERIKTSEREVENAKSSELTSALDLARQIDSCHTAVEAKELRVQDLEQEHVSLDRDLVTHQRISEQSQSVSALIKKTKRLIKEVRMEAERMEVDRDKAKADLDNSLQADRRLFQQKNRRKELAKIGEKEYGLELTYENFWFQRNKYQFEGVSDSASSADSSVQDVQFLDKVKNRGTGIAIKLDLRKVKEGKGEEQENVPDSVSKLGELFLAYHLKQEELQSLTRLSEQFDLYREQLLDSIRKKERESFVSEDAKTRFFPGFQNTVTWEDSPRHDQEEAYMEENEDL